MFTIDLLKGQGRPVRTRPKGIAIFVATFAVPTIVAMLLAGFYYNNKVVISIHKQNIASCTTQIERLTDAVKLRESWEKDKGSLNNCLTDVASSIGRHTQWSPILVSLVENLPESVVLSSLEVKQTTIKKKAVANAGMAGVKDKKDKDKKDNKKADTNVAVRTLRLRLCGNTNSDFDREIKAFRDRLLASNAISTKLEDVVIASQTNETMDGRDVIAYDIDCIFKSGI
jgi:Tfp pilus assembly protein PilN